MRFLAFNMILASVKRTLVLTVAKWMQCLHSLYTSSSPDALQPYWNRTTAWVLSCKPAAYFKNTFSQEHLWTAAFLKNFRLSVRFSTHMINSTREKIEFSFTNCFRSIVLLVFALATALSKFRFRSLRNKMINLVLVVKYHFDFLLQFDVCFSKLDKLVKQI